MIFGQDRSELRKMYQVAWQKRCDGLPLTPLETQVADVIALHPEYHSTITAADDVDDYAPEGGQSNPYLHMGLHLALGEQVSTNRPPGIRSLFEDALRQSGDAHATSHAFIECLAEALWQAQRDNRLPDEQAYLIALKELKSTSSGKSRK